jgi:hypothetical protein
MATAASPIIAAGGEFVIPPEKVREIGGGDIDRGHKILDHWVMSTRKKHIKTLRGLKQPNRAEEVALTDPTTPNIGLAQYWRG